MKKYVVSIQLNNVCSCMEDGLLQGDAYESPIGEWAKAEEAEAIEQLNKEMLEVLKRTEKYLSAKPEVSEITLEYIRNIIAKAEEV